MKVIITGGTGLIGRALTRNLVRDGHQVIILSRNIESGKNLPEGVNIVEWNGKTSAGWDEHVVEADAIVNLAGETLGKRWTPERKERILNSRVNAGKAVTEAIEKAEKKPGVLIQASAVGYYGSCGDNIITEESPAGHDFLVDVCQKWEASTESVESLGVRRVVIRTGIILSKKGGILTQLLLPFKFFAGGPAGNGRQYWPWIHISDQVDSIRFLIENAAASGVFNLSAPAPVTNRDFARALGKVINRPAFLRTPGFALRIILGEMATLVLDGQRAVPERLLNMGHQFRFDNPEPALRHLFYSGFEK